MKLIILAASSFACSILLSCGGNGELSKNQAKQQILEKVNFPYIDSQSLFIAHTPQDAYISAGLFQLKECECYYKLCPELTSKGKEYLLRTVTQGSDNCENYHIVKRGDVDFGEITNILMLNQSNSAEVFYTINKKVTPFGKIFAAEGSAHAYSKDTIVERRAVFTKTNDGWKIDDAQLDSHPK